MNAITLRGNPPHVVTVVVARVVALVVVIIIVIVAVIVAVIVIVVVSRRDAHDARHSHWIRRLPGRRHRRCGVQEGGCHRQQSPPRPSPHPVPLPLGWVPAW
ncbi:hypothetical protein [Nonomuraea jiangxiensis]|uniref:hypothetical protein n=1 Tax=Nonomuraea jiangxiensis TaxID=633440 RepID=UPI00115FE680|nr:hypothetical protein [Nonomuraea jiangxiensis]